MSPNWIFLPLLARNENVTGCREVPIHLKLNSVPSRASRAAIHPTAGSCRDPGMQRGSAATPGPAVVPGRGEDAHAWGRDWGLGSPRFSLRAVRTPGLRGFAWRCLARRWCWDPAPLARPDTGQAGFGHAAFVREPSVLGAGAGDAGHGRRARRLPQGPVEKEGAMAPTGKAPSPGATRLRDGQSTISACRAVFWGGFRSPGALTLPELAREPPNPAAIRRR